MAQYHKVEQGECFSTIGALYGFADYCEIYTHPKNASLHRKRPNPDVLLPGDIVFIPDKTQKRVDRATGRTHQFVVDEATVHLRIVLEDPQGAPIQKTPFQIEHEGTVLQGDVTESGLVDKEIPVSWRTAQLLLPELHLSFPLQIGGLDPIDEPIGDDAIVTGVQARLNNLGFHCGKVDGVLGPKTKAAIAAFQKQVMKQEHPTGEPDKQTRQALQKQHRC